MPKKPQQKHSKKESLPVQSGVLPLNLPAPAAAFHLGASARAEELFPVTGLTEAQLRQRQLLKNPATGEAFFPKPALGSWDTVAVLRGLLALREHQAASNATPRLDTVSFASMESCEGTTGITKTLQQLAKTSGCPAFRGPRVYLLDLVKWIFKEAAAGHVADWGKMNVELDAKLKQVKLDTELRELIRLDESADCLQRLAEIFWGGLRRMEMENPRDFEMRPRDYIKKHTREKTTAIRTQIENELKKLKIETETTATVNTEK
jgi:hypothetical protein